MDKNSQKIKDLMDKLKTMENGEALDLSSDEDLSIAIMNLISIEEHLFFTAEKVQKSKYVDLLYEVRELRKKLLKQIIKDYEGEVWCISKHLLASSMRLMEVGTKALTKGQKQKAIELFDQSYGLYNLFWMLNLKKSIKLISLICSTIPLIQEPLPSAPRKYDRTRSFRLVALPI